MFEAICAHFRAQGAATVRTLVDRGDPAIGGFLKALGFSPSVLEALEMPVPKGA
jgi:hypothetical protein